MKVRVIVKGNGYNKIPFKFENMPSATNFMEQAMRTAEGDIMFEVMDAKQPYEQSGTRFAELMNIKEDKSNGIYGN